MRAGERVRGAYYPGDRVRSGALTGTVVGFASWIMGDDGEHPVSGVVVELDTEHRGWLRHRRPSDPVGTFITTIVAAPAALSLVEREVVPMA